MTAPIAFAPLIKLLTSHPWPLSDEKQLQVAIMSALAAGGFENLRREWRLGATDIVDFMVGDIGIEVKIKGARRAIFRQVERYCAYDDVQGVILATNVPMALPPEINGKPTAIAHLGRGWL